MNDVHMMKKSDLFKLSILICCIIGLTSSTQAYARANLATNTNDFIAGESFQVSINLGLMPRKATISNICYFSNGVNSTPLRLIHMSNISNRGVLISQPGNYVLSFKCSSPFDFLNTERLIQVKTRIPVDAPNASAQPNPSATGLAVTPTPTPVVPSTKPPVAKPMQSPQQVQPSQSVVAPKPAIIPNFTGCGILGEISSLNGRAITCAQNPSVKSQPPKWRYVGRGTLCYTEGLLIRPWKCGYPYINKGGNLQFQ